MSLRVSGLLVEERVPGSLLDVDNTHREQGKRLSAPFKKA
jgi:hypothetical protein